jgi:hypothetical protein
MPVKIGYQIISKTTFALSINPSNRTEGSQLILAKSSSTDENQRWLWIFYPLTSASILYNPSTTFYAAPTELDRGAPIVLWRLPDPLIFSARHTWQVVGGDGYDAIRTPANIDLNMNAFGGNWGPGTKVGLWTWDKGPQPNELWASKMIPI